MENDRKLSGDKVVLGRPEVVCKAKLDYAGAWQSGSPNFEPKHKESAIFFITLDGVKVFWAVYDH